MPVIEKKHRLHKESYTGTISVAFTLCLRGTIQTFAQSQAVDTFVDILSSVVTKSGCIVPVYCFMPDHQHLIIMGTRDEADVRKAIVNYKQKTGFWMSTNHPGIKWQKDFYDHIIRRDVDAITHVRYILDNPVRKGLVSSWQEYPFKGSIGCKLEDVLNGIM